MLRRGHVSLEVGAQNGQTAMIEAPDLQSPAVGRTASRVELYCDSLRVNPMFRELSETAITFLAQKAYVAHFAPEERVVGRGDEIHFAAVVLNGGIRSSITNVDGYEMTASILPRGAIHGVVGVAEPTPCAWDCISFGKTDVVAVYCSDFRAAMLRFPDVSLMLAKMLSYRLKKAYSIISQTTLQTLENRVRRTLIMLAGDPQYRGQEPAHIAITQETLGNFVPCTRPTVNKVLKDLEHQGLVEVGYGCIRIINFDGLRDSLGEEPLYVL